jgi:hypothetical protein
MTIQILQIRNLLKICFPSKRPHTITRMNDNMDSTLVSYTLSHMNINTLKSDRWLFKIK